MSQGNFEAKFYSLRKSKDGVIVGFVVQPHDVSPELMALDVGAVIMIGWSEIDEQHGRPAEQSQAPEAIAIGTTRTESAPITKKPKTPFRDLPPVQQAVLRCSDNQFRVFMDVFDENECARAVRDHCGVSSRSELQVNEAAQARWRELDAEFQRWLTTQRYSESIRK